jgi:hypothetical protein
MVPTQDSPNTTRAPFSTPNTKAYRRLTYALFRKEGLRRGRLHRLPAIKAWQFAKQFPLSLAERFAEAAE